MVWWWDKAFGEGCHTERTGALSMEKDPYVLYLVLLENGGLHAFL